MLSHRDKNLFQKEEQQKTKKKKKSTKKKAIVIEEPKSQDSSSPEHNLDSQDGSLTDHEFSTGTVKSGGPQPMAPGVFLSHRRPSMSSPSSNNNSTNSMSTNSSSLAKGDRLGSADAKGERKSLPSVSCKHRLNQFRFIHRVPTLPP